MRRSGLWAAVTTVLSIVLVACGGGDVATPTTAAPAETIPVLSATTAAVTPTTTTTTAAPALTEVELGGSAWLAGIKFSPVSAVYDPQQATLDVTHDVEVTQTEPVGWAGLFGSLLVRTATGAVITPILDSGQVPGLSKATVTFQYWNVPPDFDLASATLLFGQPDEQQWELAMSPDAVGTGTEPIYLDVTGKVEAEGFYLDIKGVSLVPWACYGNYDGGAGARGVSWYAPIGSDRLTLIITGTVGANIAFTGGTTSGDYNVTMPNGNSAAGNTGFAVYDLGVSSTGVEVCFTVDEPGTGTYTLNWTSYRGGEDTFEVTVP